MPAKVQQSEVAGGTVSDTRQAKGAANDVAVGKYKIIYADPPWSYSNNLTGRRDMGGSSYPRMSLGDIKALPVPQLADKDCSLWLWATWPKMQEAFEVIRAWGFKYISGGFTWVKTNRKNPGIYKGLGHWTQGNDEACLFAKKGRPRRVVRNVSKIVISPVSRHSEKPAIVRDEIVRLMGDVPRIELFARQRVDGWDAWGNEVESRVQLESQPASRSGCTGGAMNDLVGPPPPVRFQDCID